MSALMKMMRINGFVPRSITKDQTCMFLLLISIQVHFLCKLAGLASYICDDVNISFLLLLPLSNVVKSFMKPG